MPLHANMTGDRPNLHAETPFRNNVPMNKVASVRDLGPLLHEKPAKTKDLHIPVCHLSGDGALEEGGEWRGGRVKGQMLVTMCFNSTKGSALPQEVGRGQTREAGSVFARDSSRIQKHRCTLGQIGAIQGTHNYDPFTF